MADSTVRGRFVWHELMTSDVAGAVAFYKKVTGWKTESSEHDASYLMWVAKNGPVGGVAKLGESAGGAQPHWLPYVGSTDIVATVNDAGRLGGKTVVPVTEIPNGGRYAVIADPHGATVGVYESKDWSPPSGKPGMGDFIWHELATSDYRAAFNFYQTLFGWEPTGEHDMGEMGTYFMFGLNGQAFGGMYNKSPQMPTQWVNYALVASAHRAGEAATKAGGRVINGPMQVPGGSWITIMLDPQGATNAVVTDAQPQTQPERQPAETAAKKRPLKKKVVTKSKSVPAKKSAKKKSTKKAAKKPVVKKKLAKKKAATRKPVGKKKSSKKKVAARRTNKRAKRAVHKRATKKRAKQAARKK